MMGTEDLTPGHQRWRDNPVLECGTSLKGYCVNGQGQPKVLEDQGCEQKGGPPRP